MQLCATFLGVISAIMNGLTLRNIKRRSVSMVVLRRMASTTGGHDVAIRVGTLCARVSDPDTTVSAPDTGTRE